MADKRYPKRIVLGEGLPWVEAANVSMIENVNDIRSIIFPKEYREMYSQKYRLILERVD